MVRSLLACFAHPDDEAFGAGGTLAHHARRGVRVALVCATRGEEGEISDPNLATPETLPAVREAEMRCATEAIGVADLIFLDYRDSGMAGTAANRRPDAFVNAPAGEVVRKLVGIMRQLRPQVVLTFDPYGGYGHPDHIAIHAHTVTAFHAAGDPDQFPDQGMPWQPRRLFYVPILRSQLEKVAGALAEAGEQDEGFAGFLDSVQWPEDQIHLTMDVSDSIDSKWRAILCHRTQVGADHPFQRIPETKAREIMGTETFALAWPAPAPGVRLSGLFGDAA